MLSKLLHVHHSISTNIFVLGLVTIKHIYGLYPLLRFFWSHTSTMIMRIHKCNHMHIYIYIYNKEIQNLKNNTLESNHTNKSQQTKENTLWEYKYTMQCTHIIFHTKRRNITVNYKVQILILKFIA